jgi:hypothetical protein
MPDTVSGSRNKKTSISTAPPAVRPLSGGRLASPPKRIVTPPLDHLLYWPDAPMAKIYVVIGEGKKQFPLQTQVVDLCKYVIDKLTPEFLKGVRSGKLLQSLALDSMLDLINSLLIYNCDDSRRDDLGNEVRDSKEWLSLAKAIDSSRTDSPSQTTPEKVFGATPPNYRSPFKRIIRDRLIQQPEATTLQLIKWLDSKDAVVLLPSWKNGGDRTFTSAYRDPKLRPRIETYVSRVRKNIRDSNRLQ